MLRPRDRERCPRCPVCVSTLAEIRKRVLRGAGYRMLRVTAEDVLHSLPSVVARIREALAEG